MADEAQNVENTEQENEEVLLDLPEIKTGRQDPSQGRQWYAIHTYSGYEDAVQKAILTRIETFGVHDKIFEVVVPKESEIHLRKGKPVSRKNVFFQDTF